MRHLLSTCCVVAMIAAAPCGASAQSIVDLSKPQTGKSRFVLNPDLTPAMLGAGEEKPVPVHAVSRVPACGEGCKMEQPDLPREAARGREFYGNQSSGNRTRVFIVAGGGKGASGSSAQKAPAAPEPRKTFRFRRR